MITGEGMGEMDEGWDQLDDAEKRRVMQALFVHVKAQAIAKWAARTGQPVDTPERAQAAWDAVVDALVDGRIAPPLVRWVSER